MKKLLLHACCGPCASNGEPFADYETELYFNGDNFDSDEEFWRRLAALGKVNNEIYGGGELHVDMYDPKTFETCADCIRYRLEKCAKLAHEKGFEAFTTTLTVSPHKNTDMVNRIGREVCAKYDGLSFLELNLKKNNGFLKTVQKSKELGLYRQNYCGCVRSKKEREVMH